MLITVPSKSSNQKVSRGESHSPRILFLTDAFLPHAGGARVYYYHLLRELVDASQTHLTVLTKKVPGWKEFDRKESRGRFQIVRCGRPLPNWKYQEWPKIAIPLLRSLPLLAGGRFDLIHFGDLFPQGVLSLWFKRAFGIPYVAYCHGEEITQTDGRRYQPKVRDVIFREAEVVIAANEFARQNLLRIGISSDRIEKILPGVDYVRFQPAAPRLDLMERHNLRGKKVILTVARLVPRKGHKLVLQAIRQLLPEFPDLVYLIVGTGPEEARLRELATAWNLSAAVQFAGFVSDEDLPSYYNCADIYVMPNSEEKGDMEGFGMVFLEANACGKPVVGGRSGGTSESIAEGRTGLLVDPYDPGELVEALRFLLSHTGRREQMGQAGLLRARSDFSWTRGARQLDEINHRIIAAKRSPFER